jgi:UDP-4-amino-4,6-dideoxy-N-acetyl-beta-L-altrosamine N-acetyltransferase
MILRDLTAGDREMVRRWRNQRDVSAYMYTDHTIGEEEHARWFDQTLQDPGRRYWIVRHADEDVGLGGFYHIDPLSRRASMALYLAKAGLRGKGVGTLAEHSLLARAFNQLDLNKVCGEVIEENQFVVKLHNSFGFVEEGRLRQHVFKNGRPLNVVLIGLLREDWLARSNELAQRQARIVARHKREATRVDVGQNYEAA